MSAAIARVLNNPLGAAVLWHAGLHLEGQPAGGVSQRSLLLALVEVTMHQGEADFADTLRMLASDDESARAAWAVLQAAAKLAVMSDSAAAQGLRVEFSGDMRAGEPGAVRVTFTDAGEAARRAVEGEGAEGGAS
jgi:hypothetical protein